MQIAFESHDKTDGHFHPYHPNVYTPEGGSRFLGLSDSQEKGDDDVDQRERPYCGRDDNVGSCDGLIMVVW